MAEEAQVSLGAMESITQLMDQWTDGLSDFVGHVALVPMTRVGS